MQYGTPPPPVTGMQLVRPHRGTMILVFGILGLVGLCVIFGIVAWVMGAGDLKQMRAGVMDRSGEGLTRAGMICGIISVILSTLAILFYVLIFVVFIGAGIAASQQGGGGP